MQDLSNDVSYMLIRGKGVSQSTFELSWAATGNLTVPSRKYRVTDLNTARTNDTRVL